MDLYSEAFVRANRENGYEWPQITDFWLTFAAAIVIYNLEIVTKKYILQWIYDHIKDNHDEEIKIGKVNKAARELFKAFYFSMTTFVGYYVLNKTDFLPPMLGGTGSLKNLYNNFPFVDDPSYATEFKYYYRLMLGLVVS